MPLSKHSRSQKVYLSQNLPEILVFHYSLFKENKSDLILLKLVQIMMYVLASVETRWRICRISQIGAQQSCSFDRGLSIIEYDLSTSYIQITLYANHMASATAKVWNMNFAIILGQEPGIYFIRLIIQCVWLKTEPQQTVAGCFREDMQILSA